MRYAIYLLASFVMQIVTWVITPVLPLFREVRQCKLNNASHDGQGIKLIALLSWFDTPDNDLLGDEGWYRDHPMVSHWDMVAWLYRNSLYGFKWTVLGAPMNGQTVIKLGHKEIDYHRGLTGSQQFKCGDYWQKKSVRKIGDKYLCTDFGWLLASYFDDTDLHKTQPKALFQFSIRIK